MNHTLTDGRVVAGDSRDWRLECLARFLLRLGYERRRGMLDAWDDALQQELLQRMERLRRAKRGPAP